ncbi:MAG: hypothetical protein ACRDKV_03200, partial [Solirubrobacterales bacterium]
MRRTMVLVGACLALLALVPVAALGWGRMPRDTHVTYGPKRLVEIPESIPHDPGDRIDRRVLPQLRYLSRRFVTFFVADGYGGKPHEKYGEHPLGLAVDVVPANWDG